MNEHHLFWVTVGGKLYGMHTHTHIHTHNANDAKTNTTPTYMKKYAFTYTQTHSLEAHNHEHIHTNTVHIAVTAIPYSDSDIVSNNDLSPVFNNEECGLPAFSSSTDQGWLTALPAHGLEQFNVPALATFELLLLLFPPWIYRLPILTQWLSSRCVGVTWSEASVKVTCVHMFAGVFSHRHQTLRVASSSTITHYKRLLVCI